MRVKVGATEMSCTSNISVAPTSLDARLITFGDIEAMLEIIPFETTGRIINTENGVGFNVGATRIVFLNTSIATCDTDRTLAYLQKSLSNRGLEHI